LSRPDLRLTLSPSRPLAIAILVLHSGAAACVAAVVPGLAGLLLALLLAGLGVAVAWSRALLRSARSVQALELSGEGILVELRGGERIAAQAGRRYVHRFLVTLPLRAPLRRTLLVTADMLDPESFRRLRIWALWGRLPGAGGAPLKV
jgi:hypothetical protein